MQAQEVGTSHPAVVLWDGKLTKSVDFALPTPAPQVTLILANCFVREEGLFRKRGLY